MSEQQIPERIEREMFEIRTRMSPDMTDLKKHVEPQAIAQQVKKTIMQRIQDAVARLVATLKTQQQQILESGRHQLGLARKVGESRDPAPFTDAVKSDPRPLAALAVVLALMLFVTRRITSRSKEE